MILSLWVYRLKNIIGFQARTNDKWREGIYALPSQYLFVYNEFGTCAVCKNL